MQLRARQHNGGEVLDADGGGWRLNLPGSDRSGYRLAQLEDAPPGSGGGGLWKPPARLEIQARASAADLPGTWGFGFWNDPFGMGGVQSGSRRVFPAFPQSAWFFNASLPNHLSIYDGVPGSGFFAGVIRSRPLPAWLFLPFVPFSPLLLLPPAARLARRLGRSLVRQAGELVGVEVTCWHTYRIDWTHTGLVFTVDGNDILSTHLNPQAPLGLVIWIDNQFATYTPQGKIRAGTLANPASWLEVRIIQPAVDHGS